MRGGGARVKQENRERDETSFSRDQKQEEETTSNAEQNKRCTLAVHVQRNRRLSTQPVKTSPTQHMSKYTAASTDGHSHRDLALCTVHTSYCLWILDSTDASHLCIKIKGFFTVFCLLLTLIFKVYLIVDVR